MIVFGLPSLVGPASARSRPSIVLVVTDDQTWNTLWAMPTVQRRLVAHGVTFKNAFVVNSMCCPSRASILTGQYSHSTGVYTNNNRHHGGFRAFRSHEGSTIATWLQSAGYRTALVGKYLNDYEFAAKSGYVPRGWSRWVAFAERNGQYYDYDLSVDGRIHHYGSSASDYSTDVLSTYAVDFIRRARGPLFLYFAPFAPHGVPEPAPRDETRFSGLRPYRPPNFNERDVSDKPRWLKALPLLSSYQISHLDRFRRRAIASLLAVDDAVRAIIRALRASRRLGHTMIVLTSDNGLAFGEHRWRYKMSPYEESIRVPLVVRYDPLTHGGRTDRHLALNIDVAPTFAELAGARPTAPVEGRSLLPLLRRRTSAARWRRSFLVEHIVAQPAQGYLPAYCAVRTRRYLFVIYQYRTGLPYNLELYDLAKDPFELVNRARAPGYAGTRRALKSRLVSLCHPPPPGYHLPG
jgi:N-acetylglucosamine-6-sulfatase